MAYRSISRQLTYIHHDNVFARTRTDRFDGRFLLTRFTGLSTKHMGRLWSLPVLYGGKAVWCIKQEKVSRGGLVHTAMHQ